MTIRNVMQFFSIFLCFCCSISYSADYPDSLFAKYNFKNSLRLKTENGAFLLDCVSTHVQMKQQVNSIRAVFKGSGIETLWNQKKGTAGNIASSTIEFVFSDGTSTKYPVSTLNDNMYFTTITRDFIHNNEPAQRQFKNYSNTFNGNDLGKVFDHPIGNFIKFYSDTEAQVVCYLFFKDLYYQNLCTTLKPKSKPIQEKLIDDIKSCFTNQDLKEDEETINKIKENILPFLQKVLGNVSPNLHSKKNVSDLKQAISNMNGAIQKLSSSDNPHSQKIQIKNSLSTIKQKITDPAFAIPLVLSSSVNMSVISVILHIHTELDPCQNCVQLLSNLSKLMNKSRCDPKSFLESVSSIPLPNAKFTTIVSSSTSYPGNEIRNQSKVYGGDIMNSESFPDCIFMPINNLNFSSSLLFKE